MILLATICFSVIFAIVGQWLNDQDLIQKHLGLKEKPSSYVVCAVATIAGLFWFITLILVLVAFISLVTTRFLNSINEE